MPSPGPPASSRLPWAEVSNYDALLRSFGPSAWWKLADAVGSTSVRDWSGNGYTGTVNGGVTFGQPGPIAGSPADTGALFDGSAGYIAVAPAASMWAGSFSVIGWVNPSATPANNTGAFAVQGGSDASTSLDFDGLGHLKADFYNEAVISNALVPNLQWTMVGFSFTRSTLNVQLWINGAADTSGILATSPTITSTTAYLGVGIVNIFFSGTLAEVAIFPTALTAAQVAALWEGRPLVSGGSGFPQLVGR